MPAAMKSARAGKEARAALRLRQDQKEAYEAAAEAAGLSLNAWALLHLDAAAMKALARKEKR